MRQTWYHNTTDIEKEHKHELTGKMIQSDSKLDYVSPYDQVGVRNWPVRLERGQKPPTGWQTVSHSRPRPVLTEEQERAKRMRYEEKMAELEELMADPVRRYKYERNNEIRRRVRRLQRQPKYSGWTRGELVRYVKQILGRSGEPTVLVNEKRKKELERQEEKARSGHAGSRRDAAIERRAEDGELKQQEFEKDFIEQIKSVRGRRTVPTNHNAEVRPMTQEDLAKQVNVTVGVIRDFEAGKLTFDGALKSKLIWKLGLSVE